METEEMKLGELVEEVIRLHDSNQKLWIVLNKLRGYRAPVVEVIEKA